MNKRDNIIHKVVTALFSLMMLSGVAMYFFKHDMAVESFGNLGFPSYLIYPLAVAKILGLVAIWTNRSPMLKEWAYAGFVFNLLLAVSAHLNAGDGEFAGAAIGLVLVIVSYIYDRKLNTTSK